MNCLNKNIPHIKTNEKGKLPKRAEQISGKM